MARNTKKGGITGSKHFEKSEVSSPSNPLEVGKELIEKAAENIQGATNGVRQVGNAVGKVSNAAKSVRNAFKGGSSLVTDEHKQALNQATEIAGSYGVELTDIQSHMGISNEDVDSSLGEGISAKEANKRKLVIQRQNNLLDVRLINNGYPGDLNEIRRCLEAGKLVTADGCNFKKVYEEMLKYWWNTYLVDLGNQAVQLSESGYSIVCIGGGVALPAFANMLTKKGFHPVVDRPEMASVKGLYQLALKKGGLVNA
jgi:hypothetical protein